MLLDHQCLLDLISKGLDTQTHTVDQYHIVYVKKCTTEKRVPSQRN